MNPVEKKLWRKLKLARQEVARRIVAQEDLIDSLCLNLLAATHLLLKSPPGYGKSATVRALGEVLGLKSRIIQYEGNILGVNLLVVEELNLCSPHFRRTLLSAMQEKEIVHEGQIYYLDQPFFVIATLNPEQPGLSSAETDRFLMRFEIRGLNLEEEILLLKNHHNMQSQKLSLILTAHEILTMQRYASQVEVSESLLHTISLLCHEQRQKQASRSSSRTALGVLSLVKARAWLNGQTKAEPKHLDSVRNLVFD